MPYNRRRQCIPLGQPLLSEMGWRAIYGGQISLLIGLAVVFLELTISVLAGALAGYYGGWLDSILISLKERDFVLAARALGTPAWHIIFRHITVQVKTVLLARICWLISAYGSAR